MCECTGSVATSVGGEPLKTPWVITYGILGLGGALLAYMVYTAMKPKPKLPNF